MYIGSPSLGFSPFDRYAMPSVPINDTLCLMYIGSPSLGFSLTYLSKGENLSEAEPMYIKHSVSLIGTGGLTYLSKGENPNEGHLTACSY
jgi:hypothetical protein